VEVALAAFNEVVSRLQDPSSKTVGENRHMDREPSTAMFVDAYEAEGLLGVVLFIIKVRQEKVLDVILALSVWLTLLDRDL
jgi:hypothetical protein